MNRIMTSALRRRATFYELLLIFTESGIWAAGDLALNKRNRKNPVILDITSDQETNLYSGCN
jgi:hypothetical protein